MRTLTLLLLLSGNATALLAADPNQSPSTKESDQNRAVLNGLFASFRGFDGDPSVKGFREHGSNAVAYLTEKVELHDDVFKRAEIFAYTNLPSGLAGKIRRPFSLTPDQIKAIKVLRQMGPGYTRQEPAIKALTLALGDSSQAVRTIAQGSLGDLGPAATSAVSHLIHSVEHTQPRLNAIWALGRIGVQAREAVPALQQVLATGDGREKVFAAEALQRIVPGDVLALRCLQNGVTDPDPKARVWAAMALREVGTKAQYAVPTLRLALQDSDPLARFHAARALVEIGPRNDQAVAVLMGTLTNQSLAFQRPALQAAQSLLELQLPPLEAVEFIKRRLHEGSDGVRLEAASIIAERGLEIPLVLQVLTQILHTSTDYRHLLLAAKAAGLIGPAAVSLRPALEELMSSRDEEVRNVAADALLRVHPVPGSD